MNGTLALVDEGATVAAGAALAPAVKGRAGVIALSGELGAGKTTFVRGLLRALGHTGAVRSPTYTLVEPYDLAGQRILHLDLYRLAGNTDLVALGLRDELDGATLLLVEWPERAQSALPTPDLALTLEHAPSGRLLHWATQDAGFSQAFEK
ncbi:MAG: tRNA (adenosine(37)-N6)-threonylcarbamoyltransferase complex ATPase subunit type 1 TsaE [Gammaproteobacteria bacterium]